MQPVLTSLAAVREEAPREVQAAVHQAVHRAVHQAAHRAVQAVVHQAVLPEAQAAVQEDRQVAQAARQTATVLAQLYAEVLVSRILRRPAVLVPVLAFHRVLHIVTMIVECFAVIVAARSVRVVKGCV